MHHPDICIAGAGIIGLSLALELHRRGHRVTILERNTPLAEASTAAAGMLAATDPDNPPQLRAISDLSITLYPNFLQHIHSLSAIRIPFQTHTTLQALPAQTPTPANILTPNDLAHLLPSLIPGNHRFILLDERSLSPRELTSALLAAVHSTPIVIRTSSPVSSIQSHPDSVEIHTATGTLRAAKFVDCTGAWSAATSLFPPVTPRKGQILAVVLPSTFPLHFVVRTPDIYIVPRTSGAQMGSAIIGATVEDAGFDKTVNPNDIARLHATAAALLPPLAGASHLEAWAGLRPVTPDSLPLLGAHPSRPHCFLATGHYRNGILLAPATAHLMAQLLSEEIPSVELAPFSPARFIQS
jgi:glycine oxidase